MEIFKRLKESKQIFLILILTLAAILRLWNLGNVPPSPSMDESSIGYNAYSVWKTGLDEYGEFPVISHRSYDDWRRATYLYLVVPFTALLGLNVIAVRLPTVIMSILTVWATYHIVLLLFSKRSSYALSVASLSSFMLAISPWHIYISRLGHESNACLSFLVFGVLFFLQGLKSKTKMFISMIFFTLAMVSYYSGQAFIPLFIAGIFFIFRKDLWSMISSDKKFFTALVIFAILLIPVFKLVFSPEAMVRFQGTSTFKPEAHGELYKNRVESWNKAVGTHDIVGTILYNRHLFPIQVFVEGYLSHFKPQWLFTNSSAQPHKVPNMGLLYLWEIPFILTGFFILISSGLVDMRMKFLVFLWFFLGPLPAALATQAPHAMRSYNFLPTWQIFTAFGLVYFLYKFKKIKTLTLSVFAIIFLFSLTVFYKNYFIIFPKEQSSSFHYALSKAIPYVLSEQNKYKKVVFSNTDNLYQSYMVFLYHSHYNPARYQKLGGTKSGGFAETHAFDKYEFRPINSKEIEENVLYIGNMEEISKNLKEVAVFKNLDGKEAIVAATK